jgi:hypothetical protein
MTEGSSAIQAQPAAHPVSPHWFQNSLPTYTVGDGPAAARHQTHFASLRLPIFWSLLHRAVIHFG